MRRTLLGLLTLLACSNQVPEFEIIPLPTTRYERGYYVPSRNEVLIRRGDHDWQVSAENVDQSIENIKATGSPWSTKRIDAPGATGYDSTGTSVDLTVPFYSLSAPDGGWTLLLQGNVGIATVTCATDDRTMDGTECRRRRALLDRHMISHGKVCDMVCYGEDPMHPGETPDRGAGLLYAPKSPVERVEVRNYGEGGGGQPMGTKDKQVVPYYEKKIAGVTMRVYPDSIMVGTEINLGHRGIWSSSDKIGRAVETKD